MEMIKIKEFVEIQITPQAQKILGHTKYTVNDLKEWFVKSNQISIGGNHVSLFLSAQPEEENINGAATINKS